MKLYLCTKCHQLNKHDFCCNQKNSHTFIASKSHEILDLTDEITPKAAKNAWVKKRKSVSCHLDRPTKETNPLIDYNSIAAIYNSAYSDIKDCHGISQTAWNRNHVVERLCRQNKTKDLDEFIEKHVKKAFNNSQILKHIRGDSLKERLYNIIIISVFGAILYGIPAGGIAVLGITIIAASPFLLTPPGLLVLAGLAPLPYIIRKVYKRLNNPLIGSKTEIKETIKTLIYSEVNRKALTTDKFEGAEIDNILKDIDQIIITMMQHVATTLINHFNISIDDETDIHGAQNYPNEDIIKQLMNFSDIKNENAIRKAFNLFPIQN